MHVWSILNCNKTAQNSLFSFSFFLLGAHWMKYAFYDTYLQLIVHDFLKVDSHSNDTPVERKPKYRAFHRSQVAILILPQQR